MSAPKKKAPESPKETPSRIQMEPLTENELGHVEGGFTEMSSADDGDIEELNIYCPGGGSKNWIQCGVPIS